MAGLHEPLLPGLPSWLPGRRRNAAADAASQHAESLDYELPVNSVSLAKQQREAAAGEQRHLYGYSGSTLTKVVATIVSGLAIGLTAAALQLLVDFAAHHRNRWLDALLAAGPQPLLHAAGALLGVSLVAVLVTTVVVHLFAPKAAGGGVALVMALLNGNAIQGLLSGRVYVTKLLGTAASRLAGLALGVEGPMIHLGASVASLVCHGEHILYRWFNLHRRGRLGKLEREALAAGLVPEGASEAFLFRNADHRELVSAGAAAGLAAAFGAPIGGVLFALEEVTSTWSRKLAWRCFLCCSVACFTMAQLHPRMSAGMLSFSGVSRLTNLQWLIQGPLLAFVSAVGGLMGTSFNLAKRHARFWRRKRPGLAWRLGEAVAVVGVTVAALMGLPALCGTCLPLPESWSADDVVRYTCPEGQYNDLATGLMGSAVWVIRSLLSLGSDAEPVNRICSLDQPCYYTAGSLAVLVVSYWALFFLASNLIVPGGLFMPCILIGSACGALLALLLLEVVPPELDVQPGIFAIVCATAMLGAVFRSSISLVVIVVEGTRGIELLFGVILAVIVSNFVAHHLSSDGLYESELDGQGGEQECYYLRQEPPHALRSQTAASIMASPVVGFDGVVPVSSVLRVLRRTTHNGFPVLAPLKDSASSSSPRPAAAENGSGNGSVSRRSSSSGRADGIWGLDGPDGSGADGGARTEGRMQGLVLRSQLLVLLRHGAFCDERGRYLCQLARQAPAAYEQALYFEMQAAAQASSSGYVHNGAGGGSASRMSSGLVGLLGPATSLGLAGVGFPTLDASQGEASVRESAVLEAAEAHAAGQAAAGRGAAFLDVRPYMNLAPMTVRPKVPASTVHHLFLALSLRHLCVVDSRSRCVGIITRKDLDHAAGSGWWRATAIAPTPRQSPRGDGDGEPLSPAATPSATWSAQDSFVRALAIPVRRVASALSLRFSPQVSSEARVLPVGSAGSSRGAVGGGGSWLRRAGGSGLPGPDQQLQEGQAEEEVSSAAAVAAAEEGAAGPRGQAERGEAAP